MIVMSLPLYCYVTILRIYSEKNVSVAHGTQSSWRQTKCST